MQESSRYNALHVAALAKNPLMCETLLDIIGNDKFIQLLYGKKNAKYCHETSCILQDLYLNMPERGRNETPLHLAVKFGSVEVVEVLTSYPQCNQTMNSDGLLPVDVMSKGNVFCEIKQIYIFLDYLLANRTSSCGCAANPRAAVGQILCASHSIGRQFTAASHWRTIFTQESTSN